MKRDFLEGVMSGNVAWKLRFKKKYFKSLRNKNVAKVEYR